MARRPTSKNTKTPDQISARLKALRQRLKADAVDALLVVNPVDIFYLTGFVGHDSWAIVPTRGRGEWIISDSRFDEQIKREAPHARVVMRKGRLVEALKELLSSGSIETLAVQQDYLTVGQFQAVGKALGKRRIKAYDDGLLEQRAIKQPEEVRAIAKAGRIQQQAFNELREMLKPGQHEAELAAFLEYRVRALGADGVSFPTIVAADANAALPHAIPGRRKLKAGSSVLIDWGARFGGYCSDMTRVVALGKMKPKVREIYQIVLDAQLAAIDAIKPGVRQVDVDRVARDVIDQAGYGEQFGHGLGHGLGLDIHEAPRLSPLAGDGVLQPGHVVTVEPGIYLPGQGGVRIEDDVLVTERGHRVLTDLPKTLESAII